MLFWLVFGWASNLLAVWVTSLVFDGVTYDDARPVLRAVTENVMLEVQKTFDFFKASASSDRITRIVVSGGASR